jgi:hypothetical protein
MSGSTSGGSIFYDVSGNLRIGFEAGTLAGCQETSQCCMNERRVVGGVID